MKHYQELLLPGESVAGERECASRWELIRPLVPARGMVLDVGSNLGYFALKAAQTSSQVGVVSVEADDRVARAQRRVMAAHGMERVCLLRGRLEAGMTAEWRETCDWFELILLLAVVHWLDEPEAVVADLAQLGGRLVVELPDHRDTGACGQDKVRRWEDPVAWLAEVTGRSCRLIGRVPRHTSEFPGHVVLVEGPVRRAPVSAYWGSEHRHPGGNTYLLDYDTGRVRLWVRGQEIPYVPGVNLVSLMHLGRLVWPGPARWVVDGLRTLTGASDHLDALPHNMLWTPDGLHLIDEDDVIGAGGRVVAAQALARAVFQWSRGGAVDRAVLLPPQRTWRRRMRDAVVFGARRWLPWPVYRVGRTVARWVRTKTNAGLSDPPLDGARGPQSS